MVDDRNGDAGVAAATAQGNRQSIWHECLVTSLDADLHQISTAVTAHLQIERNQVWGASNASEKMNDSIWKLWLHPKDKSAGKVCRDVLCYYWTHRHHLRVDPQVFAIAASNIRQNCTRWQGQQEVSHLGPWWMSRAAEVRRNLFVDLVNVLCFQMACVSFSDRHCGWGGWLLAITRRWIDYNRTQFLVAEVHLKYIRSSSDCKLIKASCRCTHHSYTAYAEFFWRLTMSWCHGDSGSDYSSQKSRPLTRRPLKPAPHQTSEELC